jgi:signal transduction histidine kinase
LAELWTLIAFVLLIALVVLGVCYRRVLFQKKAAEANLSAHRILIHHLPFSWVCWYVGEDQVIASQSFLKLLGIDDQRTFGLPDVFRLFGQSSLSQFQRALQHLYAYGGEFSLQLTIEHPLERELVVNGSMIGFEHYEHIFSKGADTNKRLIILSLQDVTATSSDLRRQQRQFIEFEHELDMLRQYIDHIPIAIWFRDLQGRIRHCNSFYAKTLETSPSRIVAESIELIKRPAGISLDINEPTISQQHAVISGQRKLLEIQEIPIPKKGSIGFARDITEVEVWESERQRTDQTQREILENLSNSIAIFASDTRLQYFNSAYLKMFQFQEAFLYGRPRFGDILEDLRKRRKMQEVPDFTKHKERRNALFNTIFEPIHEIQHQPDGAFLKATICPHALGGILIIFEDITDKLALERGYKTLLAVQKETIDNLHEGLAVVGSDLRLRLCNKAFSALLKLEAEQCKTGTHVTDILQAAKPLMYEESFIFWKTHLYELCENRTPFTELLDSVNSLKIQISYIPLPDGSHLFSFVDISDRWKFEQTIRERNEALEQADRLKTDFISHVSYELRAPLNTIAGFIDILRNQYFGPLNERQVDYCQGISEASQKLMQLISDMIDLASIEAGKLALHYHDIELPKFLESCAALIKNRAYDQGVELSVVNNTNIDVFNGDEKRLKHVMFNLLSNALKFTLPGGHISIIAFHVDDQPDMLRLCVSDSGVGISATDQQKIFDMFEHGSRLHTAKKGAGLGLPLVKRLIELHQGQVYIASKVNEGTQVICHLPIQQPILM